MGLDGSNTQLLGDDSTPADTKLSEQHGTCQRKFDVKGNLASASGLKMIRWNAAKGVQLYSYLSVYFHFLLLLGVAGNEAHGTREVKIHRSKYKYFVTVLQLCTLHFKYLFPFCLVFTLIPCVFPLTNILLLTMEYMDVTFVF